MPFPHELQPGSQDSPEIRMQLNGHEFFLNHQNTLICHILEGDGALDYALHAPDSSGDYIPIFFDQDGGAELRWQLVAAEFPSATSEKLDDEIIELITAYLGDRSTWPN